MSSWNSYKPHFRDTGVLRGGNTASKASVSIGKAITLTQLDKFEGTTYTLAENWLMHVNINEYIHKPIQYLEIGTRHGANLLSVANSYGAHPESQLHCIDPWEDYEDYPEYKGQQESTYDTFLTNVDQSVHKDKIKIYRGYSHQIVPQFDDEFFDIIYIDGNHEPEYVLEDAVLSFRKLKNDGILIFDDYGWGGPDLTQRGIDGFLSGYHKRMNVIGLRGMQVFARKK
jgi:hypothetical protein